MNWIASRTRILLVLTLVFLCHASGDLQGHDIWLEPDDFVIKKGDTLVLRQWIGPELAGPTGPKPETRELPFLWSMTPRFALIDQKGVVDLLKELPNPRTRAVIQPILKRSVDIDGLALLAMEHKFIDHEMPTGKFREYLEHEELSEKFGDSLGQRPVERERYRRALKSLVRVGDRSAGDLHERVLGQQVEILLLQDPYRLEPGDSIDVKALFQGEPLTDQRIVAHNRDLKGSVSKSTAYTDSRGIARFKLSKPGLWLLRLVHLIPCTNNATQSCAGTDWKSYWASYTFELDQEDT